MIRMQYSLLLFASLLLLAGVLGCARSARVTSVDPAAASPGMIVQVTTDKSVFQSRQAAHVEIGEQVAVTQNVLSDTSVEVIVPNLAAGEAEVRVIERGKKAERSAVRLRILPARSQQLVLSFQNNSVSLLSASLRGGEAARTAEPDQRRLSYDVFNEQGGFVYSGALVHPAYGRMEIYDETQTGDRVVRGDKPHDHAVFAVKIPNVPGHQLTIKFYDAPAGVDLNTDAGRAERQFLNEITINR
ncbi:hypothetical protein HUU05_04770 [candidate division KSB1 bacterium]|nr:hypothetical protein [candidate division KSB1 bacterium]